VEECHKGSGTPRDQAWSAFKDAVVKIMVDSAGLRRAACLKLERMNQIGQSYASKNVFGQSNVPTRSRDCCVYRMNLRGANDCQDGTESACQTGCVEERGREKLTKI